MPFIRDNPEMCRVIESIAIINANKNASKTGTYTLHKNLVEGFSACKTIIEKQLEVLKPRVHIFGGTFFLYKDFFDLTDSDRVHSDNVIEVWLKDSKLYLNVYHPANRITTRKAYVGAIVVVLRSGLLLRSTLLKSVLACTA